MSALWFWAVALVCCCDLCRHVMHAEALMMLHVIRPLIFFKAHFPVTEQTMNKMVQGQRKVDFVMGCQRAADMCPNFCFMQPLKRTRIRRGSIISRGDSWGFQHQDFRLKCTIICT